MAVLTITTVEGRNDDIQVRRIEVEDRAHVGQDLALDLVSAALETVGNRTTGRERDVAFGGISPHEHGNAHVSVLGKQEWTTPRQILP